MVLPWTFEASVIQIAEQRGGGGGGKGGGGGGGGRAGGAGGGRGGGGGGGGGGGAAQFRGTPGGLSCKSSFGLALGVLRFYTPAPLRPALLHLSPLRRLFGSPGSW